MLVVRALREDADDPVPPYLKSMLGGTSNLRGFRTGTAVGDTLVASSIELRVPLTSPLSIGKVGVSAFVDAGAVHDKGARFREPGDRKKASAAVCGFGGVRAVERRGRALGVGPDASATSEAKYRLRLRRDATALLAVKPRRTAYFQDRWKKRRRIRALSRRCPLRMSALALTVLLVAPPLVALAQQPIFRGGVEVIEVDASVIDDRGHPVADLRGPEFTVTVDGKPRKVDLCRFRVAPTRRNPGRGTRILKRPTAPSVPMPRAC